MIELELEPATAAEYVLWHFGDTEGEWKPPGGFYQKLMDALGHADMVNKARLASGFPCLCAMWLMYEQHPEMVVSIAREPELAQAMFEVANLVTDEPPDLERVRRLQEERDQNGGLFGR